MKMEKKNPGHEAVKAFTQWAQENRCKACGWTLCACCSVCLDPYPCRHRIAEHLEYGGFAAALELLQDEHEDSAANKRKEDLIRQLITLGYEAADVAVELAEDLDCEERLLWLYQVRKARGI